MTLPKAEWRRRIAAATALHGIDLSDLDDRVSAHGLPVGAARRAGHDSDKYQPNHALALVLAEELELPVAWFEAEDWRPLIHSGKEPQPEELPDRIADLRNSLDELQTALEAERAATAALRVEGQQGRRSSRKQSGRRASSNRPERPPEGPGGLP